MDRLGERAVVLGAGLAGLVTARVLSEFYADVVIVERDRLAEQAAQRRGVPQGRHLHSLLSRGSLALVELFPGLLDELAAAGAPILDEGDLTRVDFRFGSYGFHRTGKFADPAALVQCLASRPLVEFHVRRRVAELGNVRFLDGHEVIVPIVSDPGRVTGVAVADRGTGRRTLLDADLVADAMGRAARTPAFLETLGYPRPIEQRSASRATYYSQVLSMAADAIAERLVLVRTAGVAGGLVANENGSWMLTITQLGAGAPPADFGAMCATVAPLVPPSVFAALRAAAPRGPMQTFGNAAGVWRRYDKLGGFPQGLIVVGDALCALNPIWGQGMTLAAVMALDLRDCLRHGSTDLAPRFFASAADRIAPIWAMNQARERPQPDTPAGRSVTQRVSAWVIEQAFQAAPSDIVLTERFLRVANLIDPPERMREPAVVARVLALSVKRNVTFSAICRRDRVAAMVRRARVRAARRRRTGRVLRRC